MRWIFGRGRAIGGQRTAWLEAATSLPGRAPRMGHLRARRGWQGRSGARPWGVIADDAGRKLAGRYVLERELGRGGMGSVWVGEDTTLSRSVAIKMMVRELAENDVAIARFEREAKAVARLHSPHIVELYDYGVDDGNAFMVMELLRGHDLAARLQTTPVLPLEVVARIIAQTAKALTTAHALGVVHRDLKPGNIFLVRDHDDDYVKVFDFGLATAFKGTRGRKLTQEGTMLGTPRYMSPEQLVTDASDPRDDVWALSVIAYRVVSGGVAFPGTGIADVVGKILETTPPPPSHHLPSLPPAVDALFAKAFLRDRNARFQTARDLATAMLEVADASIGFGVLRSASRQNISVPALEVPPPPPRAEDTVTPLVQARTAPGHDPPTLVTGELGMARGVDAVRAPPRRIIAGAAVLMAAAIGLGWLALSARASDPAIRSEAQQPRSTPEPPPSGGATTSAAPAPSPTPAGDASAAVTPPSPPTTTTTVRAPAGPAPRLPAPTGTQPKPAPKKKDDLFDGVY